MEDIFDRAYGCILGQAIGDSFGFSYENNRLSSNIDFVPPILGGRGQEAGQVTDDTEMAMALARSLQRCRQFDLGDIARSYASWFYTEPPDIGVTTYQAFRRLPEEEDEMKKLNKDVVLRKLLRGSDQFNRSSLSNGCLMRLSPLGIAGSTWSPDSRRSAAEYDCRLTHPNPIARDASATFVDAISILINTGDKTKAYEEAIGRCRTSRIRRLLEVGENKPIPIYVNSEDESEVTINGDQDMMGYLGVALKWAFYELRNHGDDFERALIDVVQRGGDTDTNGCIAGALVGACVGAKKINEDWKKCVSAAKPRRENYDWARMSDAEEVVRELLLIEEPNLDELGFIDLI